jgi:multicomponent Na+:H+ antiporter subunit F
MEFTAEQIIQYIALAFLLVALAVSLYRLVKGPAIHDRIVAMDLVAAIVMGFILVYSVLIKKAVYFDIAIMISLVSFIATVAVSTYIKLKK